VVLSRQFAAADLSRYATPYIGRTVYQDSRQNEIENEQFSLIMRKWTRVQVIVFLSTLVALTVVLVFAELISTWLTNWAFIKILDAISKLGVLIAVIAFLVEIPTRKERIQTERKRAHFDYWQAIDAAAAAGISTSYARKIALENLASDGATLRNLDAPESELRRINLTGADLVGANLTGTDLTGAILDKADLSKASLYRARLYGASLLDARLDSTNLREILYDEQTCFPEDFDAKKVGAYLIAPYVSLQGVQLPKAVLWNVDLQGANLQEADFSGARFHGAMLKDVNFQGANLQGARFRSANLEGANLKEANIQSADFDGTKGLTVEQIRTAYHWKEAKYSPELCIALGISTDTA